VFLLQQAWSDYDDKESSRFVVNSATVKGRRMLDIPVKEMTVVMMSREE
jgi:hypothetical protein